MAGTLTEDTRSDGSSSNDQRCHSGESIAEWRSSEQVENGTPSTSPPPFYDTEDDDCGPKPSELYGKFTWKIEGFSQIQQTNKRELRSNSFDVGGYKWYILIYPQGCDVQNHLSLFLCVANHDKLLPGWSHFAQFTISVVNKDPKKSKYSDTLHRFWKKEHDWGWKKFMEISKLNDGFVVEDVLIIKAQVQVIRERADRPFRCLDVQYRRELVRVYLSNIDQICRRFIEDRRMKLSRLTDDKNRWSSFRSFWAGVDTSTKRRISREKTDTILKILVKQFFIEKEVTSTLVMDSMYSGLRSLEFQSNRTKVVAQTDESGFANSSYYPMVYVDQNHFVLSDDVVFLLEKAVSDTWPQLSSRDDTKSSHNRSKMEGGLGEETNNNNDKNNPFDRDNRRLTELGRRTVEFFALIQIFSRIEVAHQEAVALKRQEDLIREEEIEGIIENGKREKRAKKKQNKQKKNGKKGKDKGKNKDKIVIDTIPLKQDEIDPVIIEVEEAMSDASDNASETPRKNDDDNDSSPTNWETDASETPRVLTEGKIGKENSFVDDSSSNCSTESYNNKGRKEKNKVKKSHENSENIVNNNNKNIEHESFDDVASEQEAVKNPTTNMVDSNTAVKIPQNTLKLKSEMNNSSSSPILIQPLNSPSNSPKASAEISSTTPTSLSSLSTVTSPSVPPKSSAEISPTTPKATPTSLSPIPSPKTEPIKQPTSPLKTPPNGMSRPSIPPNRPATPVPVSVSVPPVLPKAQQPVLVSKSSSDPNFVPTSYRNAIIGKNDVPDTAGTSSSQSTFSQLEIETKDEFEQNEWIYVVPSISAEFERWRATRFAPVEFPQRASISGTVSDEFPHLDIINDLLDEDKASSPRGDPRLMQSRHRNYARQYSMPNNNRYNDQYGTSGTNNAHHLRRQYSQMDSMGFSNGYHVDEVTLNRWPVYGRGEYNMRRDMGGDNSNGFVYRQVNDYDYDINININNGMMNGIDAYRLYRPSNGY